MQAWREECAFKGHIRPFCLLCDKTYLLACFISHASIDETFSTKSTNISLTVSRIPLLGTC